MILTKEQIEEFKKLAEPMMEFLSRTGNPYAKAIVDTTHAEVVSSLCGFTTEDHIPD